MKKLLLLLLVCISTSVYAQNIANPGEPYDVYCTIHPYGFMKETFKTIRCEVSFPNMDSDVKLKGDDNKVIIFRDEGEVFSYMAKRGWEYVDVSIRNNNTYYVMKKKVLKDEEALEYINFGKD